VSEITLSPSAQPVLSPAPLYAPTPRAAFRVLEFFTAQVANPHTRQAYWNAARRFATWCEGHGITALESIHSLHVATFIRELEASMAPPTVKQNLAAIRMLFDWLVSGGILPYNPAHAVRGPKHVVKKGKTPVLTSEETRVLLDSIPTTSMTGRLAGSIAGLRDRALIGTMVYTFARINAVLGLRVEDYYIQGRRGWMNLREKGGKQHAVPCHHNLEQYLDEYLAAAGPLAKSAPLFQSLDRQSGQLSTRPLSQQDVYRMIQRRATAAGLKTRISNHTFRATGITAYLKNGGKLEVAQAMAGHESPRTTKLYDRREDEINFDEVERIAI
jgi:site-specific recombinase XerD